MGTRGLVGVVVKGKKHASYNHWDSYPANLGAKIAKFITELTLEEWGEMAKLLEEITVGAQRTDCRTLAI
jgi:hypothetical protein